MGVTQFEIESIKKKNSLEDKIVREVLESFSTDKYSLEKINQLIFHAEIHDRAHGTLANRAVLRAATLYRTKISVLVN